MVRDKIQSVGPRTNVRPGLKKALEQRQDPDPENVAKFTKPWRDVYEKQLIEMERELDIWNR